MKVGCFIREVDNRWLNNKLLGRAFLIAFGFIDFTLIHSIITPLQDEGRENLIRTSSIAEDCYMSKVQHQIPSARQEMIEILEVIMAENIVWMIQELKTIYRGSNDLDSSRVELWGIFFMP